MQISGDHRPLPARLAFVVQLDAEADVAQGKISGRVEHVQSGRATRFQRLDGLLAFLTRMSQWQPPYSQDDLSRWQWQE